MDLTGSLVDTNLKIYPSESLLNFLKDHTFTQTVPLNIAKISNSKSFKEKNGIQGKLKPLHVSLNNEDVEIIKQITNSMHDEAKNENTKIESTQNLEQETCNKESESEENKESEDTTDTAAPPKEDDTESKVKMEGPFLSTSDIEWLYIYLKEKRSQHIDTPYIHELLEGSQVELPENKVLKRNPDLEARCVKLRAQQEAREYRKMTKGVDNVRMRFPEETIAYQLKQMNRQLIAIVQFIISIFAGFLFGFRGVEWMVGNLDFGFRLLLGVMCALVIALAEIYFLAKKLNEELSVPETTQLGGPPKFVDEALHENRLRKSNEKPHQD